MYELKIRKYLEKKFEKNIYWLYVDKMLKHLDLEDISKRTLDTILRNLQNNYIIQETKGSIKNNKSTIVKVAKKYQNLRIISDKQATI